VRLLIVEDEVRLASALQRGLGAEGFTVDLAHSGPDGLHMAQESTYDAVILDIMLPELSGYRIIEKLRAAENWVPILMLTAKDGEYDEADALDLGADDYLTKPFRFAELVARVRALARRAGPRQAPVLSRGDIELDPAAHRLTRAGRAISLTRKEFGVLETLMAAGGGVVSAEELLERVWDAEIDPFTNVVRMTVMTLRRKLGDPQVVETVIGVGYRMA
jgi:DNA-binding response OmpR family regulator